MSVSDRALQASNREKHKAACRELRKHLPSFLIVGEQLLIIRDAGIWTETHKTLEAFLDDEFGLEKRRAYQLINAAMVKANLSLECTICSLPLPSLPPILPNNEGQFREVAKAPPEKQAEVVRKAAEVAAAENRKPTAKDYRKVVAELVYEDMEEPEEEEEETEAPKQPEPSHHPKEMAGPLMAHVSTLTKLLNDLKKRAADRGGEWIDVQAISAQISSLKYSLKSAIYYADCPDCGGERCAKCKQTGFLPQLKSAVVDGAK